ncbi:rabenosyn-5 isoform X2 [Corythoichthys intestinalis]|uniref:rabenosyn-5 isoform X2 n=1 Tax=Corythoichthys intestinalis TaxID=161448 RepID=UPI0025A57571|nr:rabenosyn-5 isoform X2 [Corythoichthys intestinalis]
METSVGMLALTSPSITVAWTRTCGNLRSWEQQEVTWTCSRSSAPPGSITTSSKSISSSSDWKRTNSDAAKIRAIEKSVVPWVRDGDVPFCPDCGTKFNLRNRRHHCRLCGSIMCRKCVEFVPLPLAQKLINGTREALSFAGSRSQSQSPSGVGSRRGSVSSMSSVTSVIDDKDDEKIRCCRHCTDTLRKKQHKLDDKDFVPDIVKLYERLRMCMDKVDEKAPEYIRMAESLNAGETTYNLDTAGGLRLEVQKYYELIDALSKKILTLGVKNDPQPHPKALQLQRMVRYSATLFVQEKLLGLMSLPTKEKYEELKENRKRQQEMRLQQERLAAQEVVTRNRPAASSNGEPPLAPRAVSMTKAGGWLPSPDSSGHVRRALDDPLLQQIENIRSFLRQAREASRTDEATMLEENLRQLQDEYDRRQTDLALALSQKLAEEENERQGELRRLEAWERAENKRGSPTQQADFDHVSPDASSLAEEFPPANADGHGNLPCDEASTPVEEDPSNPFCEDIKRERMEAASEKREYNPFDEDDTQNDCVPSNPFEEEEEHDNADSGNPFAEEDERDDNMGSRNPFAECSKAGSSTNPFDCDDDDNVDLIEEELLLQQIDNIRAYIFDAKLSGRTDEVELLAENLRELQQALREHKKNEL